MACQTEEGVAGLLAYVATSLHGEGEEGSVREEVGSEVLSVVGSFGCFAALGCGAGGLVREVWVSRLSDCDVDVHGLGCGENDVWDIRVLTSCCAHDLQALLMCVVDAVFVGDG